MESYGPVVVRQTIAAPQPDVWKMIVDPDARARWWNAAFEPALEGQISAPSTEGLAARSGVIDVFTEGLTLGWRWRADGSTSDTTVMLLIRPGDDIEETRITVIESGFATLDDAVERVAAATNDWDDAFKKLAGEFGGDDASAEESSLDAAQEEPEDGPADEQEADDPNDDAVSASDVPADSDAPADTDVRADTLDGDAEPGDVGPTEDVVAEQLADEPLAEESVAQNPVVDDVAAADPVSDTPDVEIIEPDIVDAEVIEEEAPQTGAVEAGDGAILLPEVGQVSTGADTTITASTGLRLDQPIEVEEVSEWELLLRGEDIDED